MQGGQQRAGRDVRRAHRLLGDVPAVTSRPRRRPSVDVRRAATGRPSAIVVHSALIFSLLSLLSLSLSLSLRYTAALLSPAINELRRRLLSLPSRLSLCLFLRSLLNDSHHRRASSISSSVFIFCIEKKENFYTRFILLSSLFILWTHEKESVVVCLSVCLSRCVEVALDGSRTSVRVSTMFPSRSVVR